MSLVNIFVLKFLNKIFLMLIQVLRFKRLVFKILSYLAFVFSKISVFPAGTLRILSSNYHTNRSRGFECFRSINIFMLKHLNKIINTNTHNALRTNVLCLKNLADFTLHPYFLKISVFLVLCVYRAYSILINTLIHHGFALFV